MASDRYSDVLRSLCSRRGFLRTSMVGAAGAALLGCDGDTGTPLDADSIAQLEAAPGPTPRQVTPHILAPDAAVTPQPDLPQLPTKFKGYQGLADLPWFEYHPDFGLRCTVSDLPQGVDFHVHLGFAFFMAPKLDLLAQSAQTLYLIDCDGAEPVCTLDMLTYLNRIATRPMLTQMDLQLAAAALPGGSKAAKTQTIPNLLAEMDRMGIHRAVLLPIDMHLPWNDNPTEHWLDSVAQAKAQDRLICFGSVHPKEKTAAGQLIDFKNKGIKGVKLHPITQRFYANDPDAMPIYQACQQLNLPVLFHAGRAGIEPSFTRKYGELKYYEQPIADFPKVRFVLGHSGCYMDFHQAVALASTYDNVWLELSGQSLGNLELLLKSIPPERVMFGTDWPFYPEAPTLAKVLMLTHGDRGLRDQLLQHSADAFLAG